MKRTPWKRRCRPTRLELRSNPKSIDFKSTTHFQAGQPGPVRDDDCPASNQELPWF